MTKANRAKKRRLRKAGQDDPHAIAPVPRHEANGKPSRRGKPRTLDIETLKSRCIRMGKSVTPANIREMRAPWWGCAAGRTIGQAVMADNERQDLWAAIVHMRRVITAHDAAYKKPRRHAVCLRLLAPVDEMSATAETPPADLRSDEDRQRQADAALMKIDTWLGYADKPAMGEAKRVVWNDAICVDPEGLIVALRCVSDGLKGKRMQYRGRG